MTGGQRGEVVLGEEACSGRFGSRYRGPVVVGLDEPDSSAIRYTSLWKDTFISSYQPYGLDAIAR